MATQWLHFRLAADKHAGNNNGDKIEKAIDLKASVEHVSRALTNPLNSAVVCVALEKPFVVGEITAIGIKITDARFA